MFNFVRVSEDWFSTCHLQPQIAYTQDRQPLWLHDSFSAHDLIAGNTFSFLAEQSPHGLSDGTLDWDKTRIPITVLPSAAYIRLGSITAKTSNQKVHLNGWSTS